jgi:hypothetical protein
MPAVMLGALLGLANMMVIALGIAIGLDEGAQAFFALTFLGSLPAVMTGTVLGVAASRTRDWTIGARYAVIGIPAFSAVMLFGCIIIPLAYYIPFAFAPTLVAVRILEMRTRATSSLPVAMGWASAHDELAPQPSDPATTSSDLVARPVAMVGDFGAHDAVTRVARPTRFDPILLGMLLGLANLVVVAIGMRDVAYGPHEASPHHGGEACFHAHALGSQVGAVFAAGFLPALITGAIVGRIAHRSRTWPVWARLLVIVPPPIAVVIALGGMSGLYAYVLPSIVTTVAAALCLERGTRAVMLPIARAI